jgi:hypothetical protein
MPTVAPLPGTDNYEAAVYKLADEYAEVHNVMKDLEIFALPDPHKETVQIIEISDSFPETRDLWPVRFQASTEFPFPTAQLIVTKKEWRDVKRGKLKILANWDVKKMPKVWPRD